MFKKSKFMEYFEKAKGYTKKDALSEWNKYRLQHSKTRLDYRKRMKAKKKK